VKGSFTNQNTKHGSNGPCDKKGNTKMSDTKKNNRSSVRPSSSANGPGLAKANPKTEGRSKVSDAERLQKRIEAAKQRHAERVSKIQAREKVRAQERQAWRALLAKQKAERDEYRKLTLDQRVGAENEDTGVHRRVEAA